MSPHNAKDMTWHHFHKSDDGVMVHPSDGYAWKEFNRIHPSFAADPRNVRLGLCTDVFCPFNMISNAYSCWPVIVTVYNLPPWKCMTKPFMFLSMIIPGPKNPGKKIDVFLRPLVDELNKLWSVGVEKYDVYRKENFQLRAALMWTISDFPAYGMLSGWSTHGKLCCPYCMEHSKAFRLKHGGKTTFFDSHRRFLPMNHPYRYQADKFMNGVVEELPPFPRRTGLQMLDEVSKFTDGHVHSSCDKIPGFGVYHNWVKKSIFWELPYWHTNVIRHNLDVMHIEKNCFENIFYTVMDCPDRSKDNVKARLDIQFYCRRPNLHLQQHGNGRVYKPKGSYYLFKKQQQEVLSWMKELSFPDGYASNISRCVKEAQCKVSSMKSHDCHVFIQRLISVAFRPYLPRPLWEALTEFSVFFRDICATNLNVNHLELMQRNIIEILCKLEKIFPPSFFDSMEHLTIHLPYEAQAGGPVQYQWMYPFERYALIQCKFY